MSFPDINIVAAMDHPAIFEPWFRGSSWDGWRVVLKAANALPMSSQEVTFFKSISGGREPPRHRVRELWCICGRRAGKDSVASLIAAYSAASFSPKCLRRGERAIVACIAPDKETGKIVQRYVDSYFSDIPPLRKMKSRTVTSDGLTELTNSVDVAVMSNDFRLIRGRPVLCAVLDELAFMRSENTSKPDAELYNAILPGMATIPQAMLIGISTPRGKTGLLYRKWKDHFGQSSDDVLVIVAPSHVLNPALDTRDRDRQMQEDRSAALAEWFAEWRSDLVAFIDPEVVSRCVIDGRIELPPCRTVYVAAVDPSGGSSDSMTLAIAHAEGDRGVLDLVREWQPPFSPQQVVNEIAEICKRYGVTSVVGDRYAGEWVREPFRRCGIDYVLASMTRSEAYLTLLPALNTPGKVELLDNRRLVSQLCGLERRVQRSGKDSVDHPTGLHDDVINAAALALVGAALAPKSSGDLWAEYGARLAREQGIEIPWHEYGLGPGGASLMVDAGVPLIDCDVDDIRAGSGHGWRFYSQADYITLRVPPSRYCNGCAAINGEMINVIHRGHYDEVRILRTAAPGILRQPDWRAENPEIAKEFGVTA